LGGILALSGLFWTIYGLYHFSKPANSISEDGVQAAKWANYYNWVWTICPAEQVSHLLRAYFEISSNNSAGEKYNDTRM
jgi:hypothetical protein